MSAGQSFPPPDRHPMAVSVPVGPFCEPLYSCDRRPPAGEQAPSGLWWLVDATHKRRAAEAAAAAVSQTCREALQHALEDLSALTFDVFHDECIQWGFLEGHERLAEFNALPQAMCAEMWLALEFELLCAEWPELDGEA